MPNGNDELLLSGFCRYCYYCSRFLRKFRIIYIRIFCQYSSASSMSPAFTNPGSHIIRHFNASSPHSASFGITLLVNFVSSKICLAFSIHSVPSRLGPETPLNSFRFNALLYFAAYPQCAMSCCSVRDAGFPISILSTADSDQHHSFSF